MSDGNHIYREFIDGLVNYQGSSSYILNAFLEKRWNHPSSPLLNDLPDEVREAIASVMKKAAETAVHDVLVYLTDRGYSLALGSVELPERPFDGALYDDFIRRIDGLPWPDSETR